VIVGLATAALVGGWGSDETSGRLELLLATPLTRGRWLVSGGIGVLVGIAVIVVVTALGIAIGTLIANGELGTRESNLSVSNRDAVVLAADHGRASRE
jgi:ABC-2 type transport system permease protein